ncbi:MarC family protein [Candidatus Bathyarchaeota archaeon]|nr:MAG: MarC family protein [Candidatus Bathyarchaeota archaeon]
MAAIPSLVRAVISLFIVVDPLGNIPIFISLTEDMSKRERRKTFETATVTGVILLLFFALVGQQIFILFGISMESFMIAGGILLLLIAVKMLLTGSWEESRVSPESVGIVPIAIPLLVGPGAITTTILNIRIFNVAVTAVSVLIVFFIVWITLRFIDPIYRLLGRSGSLIIARVMALIIAAIAVEYILEGIRGI